MGAPKHSVISLGIAFCRIIGKLLSGSRKLEVKYKSINRGNHGREYVST